MEEFSIYERIQMNFDGATGGMAPLLIIFFILLAGLLDDAMHRRGGKGSKPQ